MSQRPEFESQPAEGAAPSKKQAWLAFLRSYRINLSRPAQCTYLLSADFSVRDPTSALFEALSQRSNLVKVMQELGKAMSAGRLDDMVIEPCLRSRVEIMLLSVSRNGNH